MDSLEFVLFTFYETIIKDSQILKSTLEINFVTIHLSCYEI